VCRVKLVHEQITWKVFANPTMLNFACCTSVQFAFAPERMPILGAASRTTWFLLSVQEGTCSAIRATRCNKFVVHSIRLGYQQIGFIIIGFDSAITFLQNQNWRYLPKTLLLVGFRIDIPYRQKNNVRQTLRKNMSKVFNMKTLKSKKN
jgi:hypothetical protein